MEINIVNTGGGGSTPSAGGASGDYRVVTNLSDYTSPKDGSVAYVTSDNNKYVYISNTWYLYDDVIFVEDLSDTDKQSLFTYIYNSVKDGKNSFIPKICIKFNNTKNVVMDYPLYVDTANVEVVFKGSIYDDTMKYYYLYWKNGGLTFNKSLQDIAMENKFTFSLNDVQTGQWYREQIFNMLQKGSTALRNTNIELMTWDDTAGEFTEGAKLMCYKIENYKSSDNKVFNGWFMDNGVICLMRFKRSEFISYE